MFHDQKYILHDWIDEISNIIELEEFLYIAIIDSDHKIHFCNDVMADLLNNEGTKAFINPNFESLTKLSASSNLIFEGYITFGDIISINTSIFAYVYKKKNQFLILGGTKVQELLQQNKQMAELNGEISNLQRELIRKNQKLAQTLEQLNETNTQLEKLLHDKDLFLSILAHDLKSPFNSLLGFSSLLSNNVTTLNDESIANYAKIIHNMSSHSFHLLEDVLNWYKSQSGKMPFDPYEFELSEIITSLQQLFEPKALEKNILLHFAVNESMNIVADYNMLSAILRNLLSNAIKFTPRGGNVTLSIHNNSDSVEFMVTDSGIGLNQEEIEEILNSTEIRSKSGTSNEKGTGLGLYMCKEFIRSHNSQLEITSQLKQGSTFKFTIPQV